MGAGRLNSICCSNQREIAIAKEMAIVSVESLGDLPLDALLVFDSKNGITWLSARARSYIFLCTGFPIQHPATAILACGAQLFSSYEQGVASSIVPHFDV